MSVVGRTFRRSLFLRSMLRTALPARVAENFQWPKDLDGRGMWFPEGKDLIAYGGYEIHIRWTEPATLDKK